MAMTPSLATVLIDLSGVLYVGDQAVPGAAEALRKLRRHGVQVRFLTNTSRTPRGAILQKLAALGLDIPEAELFTAASAAWDRVRARNLRPYYLVHPDLEPELPTPQASAPDAVVLGDAGPCFDYASLNRAFRLLMAGCPLIAMARNRYFREADGLSLDMGAFVAALEYAAGVEAEIVGKPAAAYFMAALRETGCEPERAAMIGDDLHNDIGGAQAVGCRGVLVRTGKFQPRDAQDTSVRPAAILDDFPAAVGWLLSPAPTPVS